MDLTDTPIFFLGELSLWRRGSKIYFSKVSMSFLLFESMLLVTAVVEALGDIRIGRSCKRGLLPLMK